MKEQTSRDLIIMDKRNRMETKLYEIKKYSQFIKKTVDNQASSYLNSQREQVIDTEYLNVMFQRLIWSLAEMTIIGNEPIERDKKGDK